MDTSNFMQPTVTTIITSRLPAGSTLEIAPGVHVPHPHAEVNLPGAGDPRLGDTKAVTEFVPASEVAPGEIFGGHSSKPLADEVRPKVLTVAPAKTDAPTSADETL